MNKLQTGDQNLVKKINKSIVLHAIQTKGPISRAQISKDTGLNKATVSSMVTDLIDEHFVNEIGPGPSSGGRKPVMLYFNNHAGYAIGIDLGVNYVLAILTDLKGNIIEEEIQTLHGVEENQIIDQLQGIIEILMKKSPKSPYGIVGIGVGVPGIVDQDGILLFTPYLNLQQANLKTVLESKFDIPTIVANEANSGAYGEQLYGTGKNVSNLIYESIGIGIGTGIIINGELYTGSTGISGEMGHLTIETNGKKCRCGNRGCWELYASESALLQEAKKLEVFKNQNEIDLDTIEQEAKNGNGEVLQLLNTIGEFIGIGLTNIINTFNPEMIILGNRMTRFESWILNPIHRVLDERLSTYHRESITITTSALGVYSNALGSASFALSNFLDTNRVTVNH
ncbi:ROK family protein [Aquibacillus sediminis]|uniref:ROK family protein n=1 Tax=Aquibacillus sediminis TaxID=2574734 RepID=UPI00110943E1|nr:ROK family protein [Aquibacillus sediminis]